MNFKSKVCRKTRRSCLVKVRRVKLNNGKRFTHLICSSLGNRRNINDTRCYVSDLC